MENFDDEKIQRLIEEQLKSAGKESSIYDGEDAALYKIVFTELLQGLSLYSDNSLAGKVIQRIETKKQRFERIIYFFTVIIIMLVILSLTYWAIKTRDSTRLEMVTGFVIAYKSEIFFVLISIACIQALDIYLRKPYSQRSWKLRRI